MEQWDLQHRLFVYDSFIKSGESVTATQRLFRLQFNVGRHGVVPSRNTILRWVKHFRTTGNIMNKKHTGPRRSVTTPENVARVREALLRSPGRSARRHASELRINRESVRRILHKELKFHPYKMLIVQKLKATDFAAREDFAYRMQVILGSNENLKLLMSDEAHFHLNGTVNKQNLRYWAAEDPHLIYQRPLHSPKVTVWCAIGFFGIIGPYFFEENGTTVTVNSARYIRMIETFLEPELRRQGIRLKDVWFQQDGATSHTANASMAVLRRMFRGKIISKFGDVPWPPRSPDLSVCDFYLWGYLKSRVYSHKPRTLDELKNAIAQEIAAIPAEMLVRVMASFEKRLESCIVHDGHHLDDVIFHR